jgi:regulation of enolase protein 1 (concanavalin A-like superfamily)
MMNNILFIALALAALSVRACADDEVGSDDFSAAELSEIWSVHGPEGAAQLRSEGPEAFLELTVPEGRYDVWKSNDAARLLQSAPDADLQLEAKFLSEPNERYQMQGIQIVQDAQNWIRFELQSDGQGLLVYSAVNTDGTPRPGIRERVEPGQASHLRITRSGDTWTLDRSGDGSEWTTIGSFEHPLAVSEVGPFAGTVGPGHAAQVDYFQNAGSPIPAEDEGVGG